MEMNKENLAQTLAFAENPFQLLPTKWFLLMTNLCQQKWMQSLFIISKDTFHPYHIKIL